MEACTLEVSAVVLEILVAVEGRVRVNDALVQTCGRCYRLEGRAGTVKTVRTAIEEGGVLLGKEEIVVFGIVLEVIGRSVRKALDSAGLGVKNCDSAALYVLELGVGIYRGEVRDEVVEYLLELELISAVNSQTGGLAGFGLDDCTDVNDRAVIDCYLLLAVVTAESRFESRFDTALADDVVESVALIFEFGVLLGVDRTDCSELVGENISADDASFRGLYRVNTGVEVAELLHINDGLLVNAFSEHEVDVVGEVLDYHIVAQSCKDTLFLICVGVVYLVVGN